VRVGHGVERVVVGGVDGVGKGVYVESPSGFWTVSSSTPPSGTFAPPLCAMPSTLSFTMSQLAGSSGGNANNRRTRSNSPGYLSVTRPDAFPFPLRPPSLTPAP
jgi:hypothetical protein